MSHQKLLRRTSLWCNLAAIVLLASGPCLAQDSNGGWVNSVSKNTSVQLGAGTRMSTRFGENEAAGNNWSNNFNLDNVRLYFGAQIYDFLGVTLNSDINNAQGFGVGTEAGEMRILDAIARFEFNDSFNVWLGRFLPPSDRSNLSGPYYQTAWDFPYVQFGYPNIFQGRDDGVAVWGQRTILGTHLKWQVGAFEGQDGGVRGLVNEEDNPLYTGRVVLNFLDAETGYYNQSTYFGSKEILAVGLSAMHQEERSLGTGGEEHDYNGYSVDFLYEKNLGDETGTLTLEAAYHDFDEDDLHEDVDPTFNQTVDGESVFYLLGYLLPWEVGVGPMAGKFQVYFRYQDYRRPSNVVGLDEGIDIGTNYLLNGHDARIALAYQRRDGNDGSSAETFVVGTQLQF